MSPGQPGACGSWGEGGEFTQECARVQPTKEGQFAEPGGWRIVELGDIVTPKILWPRMRSMPIAAGWGSGMRGPRRAGERSVHPAFGGVRD